MDRTLTFGRTLVLALALPLLLCCGADFRTWTDSRGRKVQAEVINLRNGVAHLRDRSGKVYRLKVPSLSAQDRRYLQEVWHPKQLAAERRKAAQKAGRAAMKVIPKGTRVRGREVAAWKSPEAELRWRREVKEAQEKREKAEAELNGPFDAAARLVPAAGQQGPAPLMGDASSRKQGAGTDTEDVLRQYQGIQKQQDAANRSYEVEIPPGQTTLLPKQWTGTIVGFRHVRVPPGHDPQYYQIRVDDLGIWWVTGGAFQPL